MTEELEADLAAAAAEGVSATELVGYDPRAFALSWARERGVAGPRPRVISTVVAAVTGAVPGVGFGLFAAYGLSGAADHSIASGGTVDWSPPAWLLLMLYVLAACFAYAGAVAAVGTLLRWRLDAAAGPTVRLLARALPAFIVAGIGMTVLVSWSQDFSTDPTAVLVDVAVPAVVLAGSVAAVRLYAVARERGMSPPPASMPIPGETIVL